MAGRLLLAVLVLALSACSREAKRDPLEADACDPAADPHQGPKLWVVLTTQRAGSTWFASLLGQHPRIYTGDRYEHTMDCSPRSLRQDRCPDLVSEEAYIEQLDAVRSSLLQEATQRGAEVAVFRLVWNQLRHPDAVQCWLSRNRVGIIHSWRAAALLQKISSVQAATDVRSGLRPSLNQGHTSVPVPAPVAIHPSEAAVFVRAQERLQAEMRAWASAAGDHVELQYEDLAADTQRELARVFSAMNLSQAGLDPTGTPLLPRAPVRSCRERILNYDAVMWALRGTRTFQTCQAMDKGPGSFWEHNEN